MKKDIDLIYVKDKVTYVGSIDRNAFLDHMSHMVTWFPNCNFNALKLTELIPKFTCITINEDIIKTQDVPFIVYTTCDSAAENVLKLRRPWTIIWDFLMFYCNETTK